MPFQFARPVADTSGGWKTETSSTLNIYRSVDEVIPSDLDYIWQNTASCELRFGSLSDPGVHTGHFLRIRSRRNLPSGTISLTVELRSYTGASYVLVATRSIPNITSFSTFEYELTPAEAALINNYANLRIRLTAYSSSGSFHSEVSWIELQIPGAQQTLSPESISDGTVGTFLLESNIDVSSSIYQEAINEPIFTNDRIVVDSSIPSNLFVSWPYVGELVDIIELFGNEIDAPQIDPPLTDQHILYFPEQTVSDVTPIDESEVGGIEELFQLFIVVDAPIDDGSVTGIESVTAGPTYIYHQKSIYQSEVPTDLRFRNQSTFFKDNLLHFLPVEYEVRDTTIGDLEDFLKIVAIPLDDFKTFIEEFTTVFDPDNCEEKYLPYLAKILNFPLSDRDSTALKRRQLKTAVEWYKRKGLKEGFKILFYSLGYVVNLVELWTENYTDFYRYPKNFVPIQGQAKITSGSLTNPITITETNRNLRIIVDNTATVDISLPVGNLTVEYIVEYIDTALASYGADCSYDLINSETESHYIIIIESMAIGETSSLKLADVVASAYDALNIVVLTASGLNANVPDDYPELLENGGTWFKSPHFGIEVFDIYDFDNQFDPEVFSYAQERVELIRPAHTVLDWILYAQSLADDFSPSDDLVIFPAHFPSDIWPFPALCFTRAGDNTFYRDGRVSSRDISLTTFYGMSRIEPKPLELLPRIGWEASRGNCDLDPEGLAIDMDGGPDEAPCIKVYRDGGLIQRNTSYLRDGEFTAITWRGQARFYRDSSVHGDYFTRDVCKPAMVEDDQFIWFYCATDTSTYYPSYDLLVASGCLP